MYQSRYTDYPSFSFWNKDRLSFRECFDFVREALSHVRGVSKEYHRNPEYRTCSNASRERRIDRSRATIQQGGEVRDVTYDAECAKNFVTDSPNRGRYQYGNISCGPGRKYVDLRAMPPIDACVVLPLIHRSFVLLRPLPLSPYHPLSLSLFLSLLSRFSPCLVCRSPRAFTSRLLFHSLEFAL